MALRYQEPFAPGDLSVDAHYVVEPSLAPGENKVIAVDSARRRGAEPAPSVASDFDGA
jgi:hypothetical protein